MHGAAAAGRAHTSACSAWAGGGQEKGRQDASGASRSAGTALGCSRKSSADPADGSGEHLLGLHVVHKEPHNGLSFPETKLMLRTPHLCVLLNCCWRATEKSLSLLR